MPSRGGTQKPVMHDKARGMLREKSKDRYLHEKKEMEHELQQNRETIEKALNENYHFVKETTSHHSKVVHFTDDNKVIKVRFDYEDNFVKLHELWNTPETN